jgi:hypothetical protein
MYVDDDIQQCHFVYQYVDKLISGGNQWPEKNM